MFVHCCSCCDRRVAAGRWNTLIRDGRVWLAIAVSRRHREKWEWLADIFRLSSLNCVHQTVKKYQSNGKLKNLGVWKLLSNRLGPLSNRYSCRPRYSLSLDNSYLISVRFMWTGANWGGVLLLLVQLVESACIHLLVSVASMPPAFELEVSEERSWWHYKEPEAACLPGGFLFAIPTMHIALKGYLSYHCRAGCWILKVQALW